MNGVVVLALRRPYTFVVLSICILIFGLMAIFKTPTDVFPNIKIPVVAVVWAYAGLLPTEVSGRITYLYERQLTSNVEGIEHIESHSYYGSSIIKIFLQPDRRRGSQVKPLPAVAVIGACLDCRPQLTTVGPAII
jgi:multidrug efflux pump subunit AcrB